jgi:hypothetical protein
MGDLTTLATAKSWLSVTGAADDTVLTRLVSGVSVAAQNRMGRTIARSAYTETRNGNGKAVLSFPEGPVSAVQSLTIDGVVIPARVGVTGSGYSFDDDFLYLDGYCFTRGQQNVVRAFTAGFATTPLDLEQAVLEIIGHKYRERDRIGQGSKILLGETVSFLRDVPPDCLRVIDNYRRVVPG